MVTWLRRYFLKIALFDVFSPCLLAVQLLQVLHDACVKQQVTALAILPCSPTLHP